MHFSEEYECAVFQSVALDHTLPALRYIILLESERDLSSETRSLVSFGLEVMAQ